MLERGDLEVIHEPFSYLLGDGHFDVAGQRTTSMPELLGALLDVAVHRRRVFFKDTSDYQYTPVLADERLYHSVINTFMIREPRATVASHYAMNPNVTEDEIGFEYLHSIFEAVRSATNEVPLVIDGDDLVANPEGTVRAYCERVGLPFIGEALHWKAATAQKTWQRTERWHEDVDRSTGLVAKDEDRTVHPDNNPAGPTPSGRTPSAVLRRVVRPPAGRRHVAVEVAEQARDGRRAETPGERGGITGPTSPIRPLRLIRSGLGRRCGSGRPAARRRAVAPFQGRRVKIGRVGKPEPMTVTWKPRGKHGELDADDRDELPDSAYAFPTKRKEPLTDASHVRNALARFDQVEDVTDAEREQAFANITKAAKHYDVEVSADRWQDLGKDKSHRR